MEKVCQKGSRLRHLHLEELNQPPDNTSLLEEDPIVGIFLKTEPQLKTSYDRYWPIAFQASLLLSWQSQTFSLVTKWQFYLTALLGQALRYKSSTCTLNNFWY